MTTTETTPKIYVGTFRKYNEGSINGAWLDLTDYSSKEEFYEACAELHKDEEDPEFMFQDWENIPDSLIGESWLSENYFEYAEVMNGLDENDQEAFNIWLDNFSYDIAKDDVNDLLERFRYDYQGYYSGFNPQQDFADQLADEFIPSDAPEFLKTYFDYEKFARDLFMGDYWETDGHIFRNS